MSLVDILIWVRFQEPTSEIVTPRDTPSAESWMLQYHVQSKMSSHSSKSVDIWPASQSTGQYSTHLVDWLSDLHWCCYIDH